jgi:hypothetical protein
MPRKTFRVLLSLTLILGVALASGCSVSPRDTDSSSTENRDDAQGFTGYEIAWTVDQIVSFPVDMRAVGRVAKITKASRTLKEDMAYNYSDYLIELEQSDSPQPERFLVARQVDLGLQNVGSKSIKVGDTVLYLGSAPVADDFGFVRGVADWIIKIEADGSMDYGDEKVRPRFNSYAKKLKLKTRN